MEVLDGFGPKAEIACCTIDSFAVNSFLLVFTDYNIEDQSSIRNILVPTKSKKVKHTVKELLRKSNGDKSDLRDSKVIRITVNLEELLLILVDKKHDVVIVTHNQHHILTELSQPVSL